LRAHEVADQNGDLFFLVGEDTAMPFALGRELRLQLIDHVAARAQGGHPTESESQTGALVL
jgi:hypothetical protein